MRRQGKSSQETILQPWDRVLVPCQGVHRTVSLSSSAEPNPQQHLMFTAEFRPIPAEGSLGSRVRAVLDVMIFAFLLFFPLQCISTKSSVCFCYLNYFPSNKITSHCVSDGGKREHTTTHPCTKSGSLNAGIPLSLCYQSPGPSTNF